MQGIILTRDDLKIILRDMGSIFIAIGLIMLLPAFVAYVYSEFIFIYAFLVPGVYQIVLGLSLRHAFKREEDTQLKHAMILAGVAWIVIALSGSIPFWYYGIDFLSSFFESMSGFTTTGMTLIQDVTVIPKSILFWRSLTQWIGGVGVIMLFLVILMQSRTVVMKFYQAEARTDRIKPTISTTVTYIWRIYLFFTFAGIILYYIAGMNWFDSINHTLTSLATGGYSTNNLSIGGYSSIEIEAVSIFLMLIGGISFFVHYRLIVGDRKEVIRNPEVMTYLSLIAISTLIVSLNLVQNGMVASRAFRTSLFQVVSMITTTGYTTANIVQWPDFSKMVFLFLMAVGGCLGSTGGGFKVLRVLILLKLAYLEVKKTILPEKAVINLKVRGRVLEDEEILRIAGLFFLYIFLIFISGLLFSLLGHSLVESMSLAFSSQGNVGPVFVASQQWFGMVEEAKIILIIEMWIGRLEILPVLALISSLISVTRRYGTFT